MGAAVGDLVAALVGAAVGFLVLEEQRLLSLLQVGPARVGHVSLHVLFFVTASVTQAQGCFEGLVAAVQRAQEAL